MTPLETLRALGTGSEPPLATKQRVASALFSVLEAAALAGGAGAAAKHSVAPSAHPTALSVFGGAAGTKVLAVAAGIWLIGGVTGAAIYRAWRPQEVRVVYVDRAATVRAAAPVSAPEDAILPAASAQPGALPKTASANRTSARPSASTGSESGSDLARERALLDVARASASHGEPEQVLAVVAQHRQQFPHGRLSEEREALSIRALLSLGRAEEARQRAEAFRAAYPHSFLIPALESALSAQ
jgi:hypothetical protein